jgi:hypothetical protein
MSGHVSAQETFALPYTSNKVFDSPTASLGDKFYLASDIKIFPNGGLTYSAEYYFTPELSLGIGWGLDSVIQQGPIIPFVPGVSVKYVVSKESYYAPAIALGFDNRPNSRLVDSESRHYFKSKGVFVAVSKYYLFLSYPLGLHGGINYSVDNVREKYAYLNDNTVNAPGSKGDNNFFNMYFALDKQVWEPLSFLMEYDLALDDNFSRNPLKGYLNLGFIVQIASTEVEFTIKDLLKNKYLYNQGGDHYRPGHSREIRVFFRTEL